MMAEEMFLAQQEAEKCRQPHGHGCPDPGWGWGSTSDRGRVDQEQD